MNVESRLRSAAASLDESVFGKRPGVLPTARRVLVRRLVLAAATVAVVAVIALPMIRRGSVTGIETTDRPGQRDDGRSGEEGGGGPIEPGSKPGPGSAPGKKGSAGRAGAGQTGSVLGALRDRIAFTSTRDGNAQVYVMDTDGSDQARLTGGGEPAWSPDGERIAFITTDRSGTSEIFTMRPDGRDQLRIATGVMPAWSPDGQNIAFCRTPPGGPQVPATGKSTDIWVVGARGGEARRLTHSREKTWSCWPNWSPDGKKLVYVGWEDMNSIPESPEEGPHLWTMNADGSDQARIEGSRLWDFAPAWSPDGELIAFVNSREKLQGFSSTVPSAIWTMTPRGENRRRLTNPSEYDFRPSWSTEGSRIVFDRDPDGNYGYACGGGITITTEKQEQEGGCPYVMGPALPSIWVMNADGSGQRRLTGELTGDSWPAFGRTR